MKRRFLAAIALVLTAALLITGCSTGTRQNLTADLLQREETVVTSEAYRMYEEAQEAGYTGSYLEFLSDYDFPVKQNAGAVQKALRSVVRITATFTRAYTGGKTAEVASGGAGVIWAVNKSTGDMTVVTNYHVIYDAQSLGNESKRHVSDKISLYLYGAGSSGAIAATFAGGSMDYDVALLKVKGEDRVSGSTLSNKEIVARSAVEQVEVGDSEHLLMGERVFAVGNPNAEGIAATEGIVSMEAEYITMESLDGTGEVSMLEIRTDAAVNHGNSGGGLFDETGAFVGLVNARSEETGVEAFGYAIPSTLVAAVFDNANANGGIVSRATLGVTVSTADSYNVAEGDALRIRESVQVQEVETRAAASGKLQKNDIIVAVTRNGERTEITRQYMLTIALLKVRPNESIVVIVERGGSEEEVPITFSSSNFTEIK